jgi:hypothetical protein
MLIRNREQAHSYICFVLGNKKAAPVRAPLFLCLRF